MPKHLPKLPLKKCSDTPWSKAMSSKAFINPISSSLAPVLGKACSCRGFTHPRPSGCRPAVLQDQYVRRLGCLASSLLMCFFFALVFRYTVRAHQLGLFISFLELVLNDCFLLLVSVFVALVGCLWRWLHVLSFYGFSVGRGSHLRLAQAGGAS